MSYLEKITAREYIGRVQTKARGEVQQNGGAGRAREAAPHGQTDLEGTQHTPGESDNHVFLADASRRGGLEDAPRVVNNKDMESH